MIRVDQKNHHRHSIRLKDYDYSQNGMYFLTICCQNKACLFGCVINDEMVLNDAGEMIKKEWLALPERFTKIKLHEYTVMPNHFHAILEIVGAPLVGAFLQNDKDGQETSKAKAKAKAKAGQPQGIAPTLGDILGAFKSITTNQYIHGVKNISWPRFNNKLWQRNYYEHVIRNEKTLLEISEYIQTNPVKWRDDKYFEN